MDAAASRTKKSMAKPFLPDQRRTRRWPSVIAFGAAVAGAQGSGLVGASKGRRAAAFRKAWSRRGLPTAYPKRQRRQAPSTPRFSWPEAALACPDQPWHAETLRGGAECDDRPRATLIAGRGVLAEARGDGSPNAMPEERSERAFGVATLARARERRGGCCWPCVPRR